MLKKIIKLLIPILIIIFLFKIIKPFKNESASKTISKADKTQALAFVKAVEDYCSLEMVKGRPIPDRITNPDEVLFDGEAPRIMYMTLTNDCRAKGTFTYKTTTYEYNYKTEKLTIK